MVQRHTVRADWDPDGKVWVVGESDIPGLFVESETFDGFVEIVRDAAPFLLKHQRRLPIEIAVRTQTTLRLPALDS